jgi:quercetin dioxygenase-like cupin family protein
MQGSSDAPEGDAAPAGGLVGRVLKTADLVAYQPGAVVSRALIDKQVGTVTLFAFDQGEGLSEHTAPYDALVQVLDGEAEVTIAGAASTVKAGEMIIMPAHQPHALRAPTRFKMMLVMIRA